jgi:hypothetical protein
MHIAAAFYPGNNNIAAKKFQPSLFLLLTEIIPRRCLAMPGDHTLISARQDISKGLMVW